MAIRIGLADDHVLVRQRLKSLLEREGMQVIGEASDGQELVRVTPRLHPDVAVIDISMPLMNGLEAARKLHRSSPKTKSILLTRHDEDQYITEALRAGVRVRLRESGCQGLRKCHSSGIPGRFLPSPSVSQTVVQAYLSKAEMPTDPLTARERQVLQLVGEDKSTKDVADLLGISAKTAESHRARLMRKLDILCLSHLRSTASSGPLHK